MEDRDRDPKGRFAPGNKGGPGRPRRAVEADYLRALTDQVTPDAWREIVERVLTQARRGDMRAIGFLARYLVGSPSASAPTLRDMARREALEDNTPNAEGFAAAEALLQGLRRSGAAALRAQHRPRTSEERRADIAQRLHDGRLRSLRGHRFHVARWSRRTPHVTFRES